MNETTAIAKFIAALLLVVFGLSSCATVSPDTVAEAKAADTASESYYVYVTALLVAERAYAADSDVDAYNATLAAAEAADDDMLVAITCRYAAASCSDVFRPNKVQVPSKDKPSKDKYTFGDDLFEGILMGLIAAAVAIYSQ